MSSRKYHEDDVVSIGDYQYEKSGYINSGTFGAVFKGRHKRRPNQTLAVKRIKKTPLFDLSQVVGEITILKKLKHKNIVQLIDAIQDRENVYVIMEYCNGGDLSKYLQTRGPFDEDILRFFVRQIASAMSCLNSQNIVHRDLKPANILLSYKERNPSPQEITLKIADFGLARYLSRSQLASTHCGSKIYMAPEFFTSDKRNTYDAKVDLWSIGVIVYQCFTGSFPYTPRPDEEMRSLYARNKGQEPRIPLCTSKELKSLILSLLQQNIQNRISFSAFFRHPFLSKTSAGSGARQFPSGTGISASREKLSHKQPSAGVVSSSQRDAAIRRFQAPPSSDRLRKISSGGPSSDRLPKLSFSGQTSNRGLQTSHHRASADEEPSLEDYFQLGVRLAAHLMLSSSDEED